MKECNFSISVVASGEWMWYTKIVLKCTMVKLYTKKENFPKLEQKTLQQ